MKDGTRVKVVANTCYHNFKIGDIVRAKYQWTNDEFSLAFTDDEGSTWFMDACDYKIISEFNKEDRIKVLEKALRDIINKEVQSSPDATDFAESMDKGLVIAAIKGIARKALEDIK